jgi:hypothetical protein
MRRIKYIFESTWIDIFQILIQTSNLIVEFN